MITNHELVNQMKAWRHRLHMYPETAFEEANTAALIVNALTEMGLETHPGIGGTGVVASLTVGDGKGVIGLRADMDALNLTERGDVPCKSKNEGKMHGCGHDGHVATLLGAAKLLTERKNFSGTVRFIFQPAEEPGKGAIAMMEDGLLERFPIDEIYGFHNLPQLPQHEIHTRPGGIMASEDNFVIEIKGKGGHASAPHLGIDPLVIAAEIIVALQTIVSRSVNPLLSAVISCTELLTDGIHNAIPSNVTIKGDTRSFAPTVQALLEEKMRSISEGICRMHGATCKFTYTHEFAPTYNWEEYVDFAVQAAANVVGADKVNGNGEPIMTSEDFGAFLQKVPGCFVLLGCLKGDNVTDSIPLHNSCYNYNDDILLTGAEYFAELVKIRLPQD